jgi:hypothetical protein
MTVGAREKEQISKGYGTGESRKAKRERERPDLCD